MTILQANYKKWWSQTGSNRRPPACKAGALPAELWPLKKHKPLLFRGVNSCVYDRSSNLGQV